MNLKSFCESIDITKDQFYGIIPIHKNIHIYDDIIPDNFSPYVYGSLSLRSLTVIPNNFTPTVMNYLYLPYITKIPEDFKARVSSILYLNILEYWPKWFKPQVEDKIYIPKLKSETLKKLIENSKTRKLGYNLLNNID